VARSRIPQRLNLCANRQALRIFIGRCSHPGYAIDVRELIERTGEPLSVRINPSRSSWSVRDLDEGNRGGGDQIGFRSQVLKQGSFDREGQADAQGNPCEAQPQGFWGRNAIQCFNEQDRR